MVHKIRNVVIIGSGPGAYTAAIYCATGNLKPIVVEEKSKYSTNFAGVDKIAGLLDCNNNDDYITLAKEQAKRFDVTFVDGGIIEINFGDKIKITTKDNEIVALACIVDDREVISKFFGKDILDCEGKIKFGYKNTATNQKGIFVCGSAREEINEAIVHVSSGCMAALDAKEFIETISN